MAKSGRRGRAVPPVDTDDPVMETIAKITAWAEHNRRAATMGLLAALAATAIGFTYLNYRADIKEQAAVRLDEIRLTARGTPPDQLRARLASYVEQFGSTPYANEARVMLAEVELARDSVAEAIRLVEPAVDLQGGPVGYNAGSLLAVAEEQRGNLEAAARMYERLAAAAPHDFQRRGAQAALARMKTFQGDYAAAEAIYAELVADSSSATDGAFYAVQLGEVRARRMAGLPAPTVPDLDVGSAEADDTLSPVPDDGAEADAEES